MNNRQLPELPIELTTGTVHRVVVDLVRVGAWVEQQAGWTSNPERRRQLHTVHLACRLTAEIVRDTLFRPAVVRGEDPPTPRSSHSTSHIPVHTP